MYEDHSSFISVENENAKVWRYMNLVSFISILNQKSLFFTRPDKFKDPYEGAIPCNNSILMRKVYSEKGFPEEEISKIITTLIKVSKRMKEITAVNCWHLSDYESDAMWQIYSYNTEGIAIQSTYKKLKECFYNTSEKIYIGKIRYIDYNTEMIELNNMFHPILYKRKSFEHEKELRAVIADLQHFDNKVDVYNPGIYVETDLDILIENIYISPLIPSWITEVIKSVVQKYGYNFNIIKSTLYGGPEYS